MPAKVTSVETAPSTLRLRSGHAPSASASAPAPAAIPVANGVAVVYGYGVRVAVEKGHLEVSDGICEDRRAARLNRATSGLHHLVILGHTGTVTIDALKWLHELGAAVSMIDADGSVIFTSAPLGSDNAHLRRAQALATGTDVGLSIAAELLHAKLAGQARVARELGQADEVLGQEGAADRIVTLADALDSATSPEELRAVEASAAGLYWEAWQAVPIRFARKDQARVPEHWRTFGPRSSPLANGPRSAATPGNAALNLLYAVLETQTRIALLTVGLDPALGFLHADQPNRDSLACDAMEAVRPEVDAWLLGLLRGRVFARTDFFERDDGVCRVTANLARELCSSAPTWRKLVGPVAERIAQTLMAGHGVRLPTRLSEANRSAGRTAQPVPRTGDRATAASSASGSGNVAASNPQPSTAIGAVAARCTECGKSLADPARHVCDVCLPEVTARGVDTLSQAGPAALSALRAQGADPAHGGAAGVKRGRSNAKRARERAEWEAEHGDGAELHARFARETLPKLRDVSLEQIRQATGLSLRYCSLIRSGTQVPHPMYVEALADLVASR